jgi:hypothetical protein
MSQTSKYLLAEQVSNLLKGGDRSASTSVEMPVIIKLIEQLINTNLKTDFFNTHLAAGETIPDGLVVAIYEKIPVDVYKKDYSRAKLPAMPISLPRNMGVYAVMPWIPNESLDTNTITAVATGSSTINVSWTVIENATSYYLERATDAAFTENLTPLYSGTNLTYSDFNLSESNTYWYRVQGLSVDYNDSIFVSTSATTTAKTQLATPELKIFTVTDSTILCEWVAISNATNYVLQKAEDAEFTINIRTIYNGSALSYLDTGLTPNTTYYYRLKATAVGYIDSFYSINGETTEAAGLFDNTFDLTFN